MTFQELKLSPALLRAIDAQGYQIPTPIQQKTIPALLEGRDMIGCAQTGTGKTAAFALPILQNLSAFKGHGIRALILTPTRELAIQILENFRSYGSRLPLKSDVIFGGVSQVPQVERLRKGVDILVATPGRLNDLIQQKIISLSNLEIFVLDEADRMLDMGFIHDVKKVLNILPPKRQSLLYSATLSPEIEVLARTILRNPLTVKVNPVTSKVDAINQCLYLVDKKNKSRLLTDTLYQKEVTSALVFTRTKYGANNVVKDLEKAGIKALAIHGNKSQTARQEALSSFKRGALKVLVATDIAARGIDVPELSHVINYDLPNEPETYIHRIGRTGRAGASGIAISFCCIDEMEYLRDIQRLTGQKIPEKACKWPMVVMEKTVKPPCGRFGSSDRPAKKTATSRPSGRTSVPVSHADAKSTSRASHPSMHSGNQQRSRQPARKSWNPSSARQVSAKRK